MRRYRALIIIIAIIIIGMILDPFGLLQPVKDIVYRVSGPVTISLQRLSHNSGNFFVTLSSFRRLARENEELRADNLDLKASNATLKEIGHENTLLKEELNFMQTSQLQLIPAVIIAKSPSGFVDTVILNRGSHDGVKINQAVVSHGFLIGQVKKVTTHTSEILLITSNSSMIPALMQQSRGTGLLHGGLSGLHLEDIQLDITVQPGENVISSSLGKLLPQGIPIGTIKAIISSESDMSQAAAVTSPVAFSSLEIVFIVK